MNFRSRQLRTIAVIVCLTLIGLNAHAQKRRRAPARSAPAKSVSVNFCLSRFGGDDQGNA